MVDKVECFIISAKNLGIGKLHHAIFIIYRKDTNYLFWVTFSYIIGPLLHHTIYYNVLTNEHVKLMVLVSRMEEWLKQKWNAANLSFSAHLTRLFANLGCEILCYLFYWTWNFENIHYVCVYDSLQWPNQVPFSRGGGFFPSRSLRTQMNGMRLL